MRKAAVYNNDRLAGFLTEVSPRDFVFQYETDYFYDKSAPAISMTLPKNQQEYRLDYLFPFFANMLSEGHNRIVQARMHHLDAADEFGILLATAQIDTPGSITIKEI